jgi:hypothetical protein
MGTNQTKIEKSFSNILDPFDSKKIDIQTKQMTLDAIFCLLKNDEIDLLTGFQRKTDLWDETEQSRLIESILISLPLSAFYFDVSDDGKWLVINGLQRLCTFKNFIIDKKLRLQNLEYLEQFNGKTFDELPGDLQKQIEECEMIVHIIKSGTPIDVKYNIFKRINTSGFVLEPAEIRHALNQGKPANFIQELSQLEVFKKATSYSIPTERMQDRDYVTRFIAFYLQQASQYQGDLERYLNVTMYAINHLSDDELAVIKQNFIVAMVTVIGIFGNDAFRKRYHCAERKYPPNKALFEVWSVLLAKLTEQQRHTLIKHAALVKQRFLALLSDNIEFEKSIGTAAGNKKSVITRFTEVEALINQVLEDDE